MNARASSLVRETLEEYSALVRLALERRLDAHAAPLYRLAADYPQRGGRYMRASLCLAVARAFGAPLQDALHSAVALELMHNAFLVHDDVEDDSDERRGRPTLHRIHGAPIAINVGDALAVLSLSPLLDNRQLLGTELSLRILEETASMARESVEGQALELSWRRDNVLDLSEADYLKMILQKTCWYSTIYPCRVGALIGTRGAADLERCVRYAFFLGAAFQIQDDLLNLTGDPERYGKEIAGDLWEGKRTLMLIRLMNTANPDHKRRLADIFARERSARSDACIQFVRRAMAEHDALDYAEKVAHGLAGAARHEFVGCYGALPDSRDKRFLAELPSWVLSRD